MITSAICSAEVQQGTRAHGSSRVQPLVESGCINLIELNANSS